MSRKDLHAKVRIDWIDLIRPGWRSPYAHEIQFEVLRWLAQTGWGYRSQGRATSGVYEALFHPGVVNAQHYPIASRFSAHWPAMLDVLDLCFRRALLSMDWGGPIAEWRQRYRINVTGRRWIPIRYRGDAKAGGEGRRDLYRQFFRQWPDLVVSPNEYHADAVNIQRTWIHCVEHGGWTAGYRLGCHGDTSSGWDKVLDQQGPRELFTDFLEKACKKLLALTVKEGKA